MDFRKENRIQALKDTIKKWEIIANGGKSNEQCRLCAFFTCNHEKELQGAYPCPLVSCGHGSPFFHWGITSDPQVCKTSALLIVAVCSERLRKMENENE